MIDFSKTFHASYDTESMAERLDGLGYYVVRSTRLVDGVAIMSGYHKGSGASDAIVFETQYVDVLEQWIKDRYREQDNNTPSDLSHHEARAREAGLKLVQTTALGVTWHLETPDGETVHGSRDFASVTGYIDGRIRQQRESYKPPPNWQHSACHDYVPCYMSVKPEKTQSGPLWKAFSKMGGSTNQVAFSPFWRDIDWFIQGYTTALKQLKLARKGAEEKYAEKACLLGSGFSRRYDPVHGTVWDTGSDKDGSHRTYMYWESMMAYVDGMERGRQQDEKIAAGKLAAIRESAESYGLSILAHDDAEYLRYAYDLVNARRIREHMTKEQAYGFYLGYRAFLDEIDEVFGSKGLGDLIVAHSNETFDQKTKMSRELTTDLNSKLGGSAQAHFVMLREYWDRCQERHQYLANLRERLPKWKKEKDDQPNVDAAGSSSV